MMPVAIVLTGWAFVACSGCGLLATAQPESNPHLPPVDVSLPGSVMSHDSAPRWTPVVHDKSPAGNVPADSKPLDPATELRQLLAELKQSGSIDAAAYDDLQKNIATSDPAALEHLVWLYRSALRGSSPSRSSKASQLANDRGEAPTNDVAIATDDPSADKSPTKRSNADESPNAEPEPEPAEVVKQPAPVKSSEAVKPSEAKAVKVAAFTEDTSDEKAKPTAPGDWKANLNQSIADLEANAERGTPDEQSQQQALLRLLYLAAGRKSDAMRPLAGLGEAEQDFWSKELYGLNAYLDHQQTGDRSRRAAEATRHLSQAAMRLGETSQLQVRNLAFCSEVVSYGVFTAFAKSEFKPGQQVLLYAEVENFRSEETPKGFHTALKSHYKVIDSQSRQVEEHDFALSEERCQNARRDYFVRYFVTLPARIYDGRYTLQLTVEDTLGKKVGQSTIDFTIKTK